jgi:hypothetical protein
MTTRAMLGAVLLACAAPAAAQEINGCTLWNSDYRDESWNCMDLHVEESCTYYVCAGFICVPTPGLVFEGWFPEYALEATNRSGESLFANGLGVALAGELIKAKSVWNTAAGMPAEQYRVPSTIPKSSHETQMMFGRAVRLPYAALGWAYAGLAELPGDVIPTCFLGIGEFVPETWADTLASGDRKLAAAWAPLTGPACAIAAPIAGAVAPIGGGMGGGSSVPCAIPLAAAVQSAAALASPSAYNPAQQCMNSLGPRLPRTGYSDGDPLASAQRTAWRIASLSEDMFKTGVGVQARDKWQLVYPKVPRPACFTPGQAHLPMMLPGEVSYRLPGYDAAGGLKNSEFVFVVWRHHAECVSLPAAAAIQGQIALFPPARIAACAGVTALTGSP